MDMTKMMIQFKKNRPSFKKKQLNVTVVDERLTRIEESIAKKSEYFDLLGPSDRLDFCLYMLERFMTNSSEFDIEAKNDAEAG